MYYLTNWHVFWHIENFIGDRLASEVYICIPEGWQVIEVPINLEAHRGWSVHGLGYKEWIFMALGDGRQHRVILQNESQSKNKNGRWHLLSLHGRLRTAIQEYSNG